MIEMWSKFSKINFLTQTSCVTLSIIFQLWALLHFIMPTMFDSHDEFNEWFSKDIESHAEKQSGIDESKYQWNPTYFVIRHLNQFSIYKPLNLVWLWNHARICSWCQPVLSNEVQVFVCSCKQPEPLMGFQPTPEQQKHSSDRTYIVRVYYGCLFLLFGSYIALRSHGLLEFWFPWY